MKSFTYGDEDIDRKECTFAVPSFVLGVGVLTLPRVLAEKTESYDGILSLLIAGVLSLFFTWIAAKLVVKYAGKTIFEYGTFLLSKPLAWVVILFSSSVVTLLTAFEVRMVGTISKDYLFDQTPIEVITFVFLLVVIYAVSGSRAALFRLNIMFVPIVFVIAVGVLFMSVGFFEFRNLQPFFISSWKQIAAGVKECFFSFLGFNILMYYTSIIRVTKKLVRSSVMSMSVPFILYIFIYTFAIGEFSNAATRQLMFPTIELAKEVRVPGEFFERFESIFFTVWIMTLFNTTVTAFDIVIIHLQSIFPKVTKWTWVAILSPLIYFIALTPQTIIEVFKLGDVVSYGMTLIGVALPILLFGIDRWKGRRRSAA